MSDLTGGGRAGSYTSAHGLVRPAARQQETRGSAAASCINQDTASAWACMALPRDHAKMLACESLTQDQVSHDFAANGAARHALRQKRVLCVSAIESLEATCPSARTFGNETDTIIVCRAINPCLPHLPRVAGNDVVAAVGHQRVAAVQVQHVCSMGGRQAGEAELLVWLVARLRDAGTACLLGRQAGKRFDRSGSGEARGAAGKGCAGRGWAVVWLIWKQSPFVATPALCSLPPTPHLRAP